MTRIDFYLIQNSTSVAKPRLACRLADKAYHLGHRIYLHTENAAQTRQMDEMLWTFSAGSFIPHAAYTETLAPNPEPVLIGHGEPPAGFDSVLICLAPEVPAFFSRFERMTELVDHDEQDRQRARERFRFYRDRGYDLHTHEVAV